MQYTNKQISRMTNFEINKNLHRKVLSLLPSVKEIVEEDGVLWVNTTGWSAYPIPDYCNNWHYIMLLAVKYKVTLCPAQNTKDTEWYADAIFSSNLESCFSNQSPQRAIASCLLAMDLKHE
jgi:hypothetical protein